MEKSSNKPFFENLGFGGVTPRIFIQDIFKNVHFFEKNTLILNGINFKNN